MTLVSHLLLWTLSSGLLASCGAAPLAPGGEGDTTVVLTWNRDGGFAGFCDELKLTASGTVTATACGASPRTRMLTGAEQTRLSEWRRAFAAVTISSTDGGTADGMTLKLTLAGRGSAQPSTAERQQLLDWAQRVYVDTKG